ncbi:MAG: lipid II:glycine glycyltransferase FemX [Gemmataceae bacterium]
MSDAICERGCVEQIESKDDSMLDGYVAAHPQGSVYQLSSWAHIFRTLGYESFGAMARREPGGPPTGMLRLYRVRGLQGRRLVAVPFRDRGGPLWDDPASLQLLLTYALETAQAQGAAEIIVKSLQPMPADLTSDYRFEERLHWIRSSVNLAGQSRERYWKELGSKTRNMIRQAERAGLSVAASDNPLDEIDVWHELHLATQQELGVPCFPRRFFAKMFAELCPAGRLKLFVCRHKQEALAACIVFRLGTTAIYGYSASYPAGRPMRPNDLMLFQVINSLIDEGFTCFDMGSDSPAQNSLLFFKKKWLAQQEHLPTYVRGGKTVSMRDSSDARYDWPRKFVQRLPRSLYRLLGSIPTPYFG